MVLKQLKKANPFYLLIILAIPASVYLILPGFYEPHDLHHFADIYQMYRAFASGQLPPRWGPDFLYNYGYPLYNFYYVLPFYLGGAFFAMTGSIQFSFELVFITSILLSLTGMYLFLRKFFERFASLAGATLFVYTPYRAVQIYVRGAMGEMFALSLFPFVLWAVVGLIKKPKDKRFLLVTSLITALFILSHNYLWALSLPWVLLLIITLLWGKSKKKIVDPLKSVALSGAVSVGLTAYWWLPALLENNLVSSYTPFPLLDHFPFVKQLIIPSWGYGSSVWGPGDEISFQVGLLNLLVIAVLGIYLLAKRFKVKKRLLKMSLWALTGFAVSLVMMNSRTYIIWKNVPFHNFIQFPWRLLIYTTFFSSVAAALLVELFQKRSKVIASLLVVGLSMLLTFNYFKPSELFYKSDNEYLSRFFATRTIRGEKKEVSQNYLTYSEDYLLLPDWSKQKPRNLPNAKIEIEDGVVLDIVKRTEVKWEASVYANEVTKVVFNSLYFPGWFAEVDGERRSLIPSNPYGQSELVVSEGEHKIKFYWAETTLRKVADYISLLSLGVLLVVVYKSGLVEN